MPEGTNTISEASSTLSQLLDQRASLDAQIEATRRDGRDSAIMRIKALAAEFGIRLKVLEAPTIRAPRPPKYRDPNTGATWSGNGMAPRWMRDAVAKGRSRDSFLIDAKPVAKVSPKPAKKAK